MATEVRNAIALRKALREFSPELAKQTQKEMAAALKPLAAKARSYVPADAPMRGWAGRSFSEARFPTWNTRIARSGIGYRATPSKVNDRGFVTLADLHNKTAPGAIAESAGRKSPSGQQWVGPKAGGTGHGVSRSNNPGAGRQFIKNLGPLYGDAPNKGRYIGRAWHEDRGAAKDAVIKAITTVRKNFVVKATVGRHKAA
jgi:hypothetical protein